MPQAVSVTESESTLVDARDAGCGGSGELVFCGDRVQARKVRHSGDGRWRDLHNSVSVLRAPELYTQIWLKEHVLYYVTFTAIKEALKKKSRYKAPERVCFVADQSRRRVGSTWGGEQRFSPLTVSQTEAACSGGSPVRRHRRRTQG